MTRIEVVIDSLITVKKEPNTKNEIVSAYDEDGNPKKEFGPPKLSKGFKVFLFIVYGLGLVLGLGLIFLLERCAA